MSLKIDFSGINTLYIRFTVTGSGTAGGGSQPISFILLSDNPDSDNTEYNHRHEFVNREYRTNVTRNWDVSSISGSHYLRLQHRSATSNSSQNTTLNVFEIYDDSDVRYYNEGEFEENWFEGWKDSTNHVFTKQSDNLQLYAQGGSNRTGLIIYYEGEEPSFLIKGIVNLNASPLEGAVVRLFNQDENTYITHDVTNASGEYLFEELEEGVEYHVTVEYFDEATDDKYYSKSAPFIQPWEDEE